MNYTLLTIEIRYEQDVVLTRQRARQVTSLLEFSTHEQTAFATAVSELTRNSFRYAQNGRVVFSLRIDGREQSWVFVEVSDSGPGIANLKDILEGNYVSQTGMGLGIHGAKRLSDNFDICSELGKGTTVTIGKRLPRHSTPIAPQSIAVLTARLTQYAAQSPLAEVQEQNKELMRTMEDLRARQAEVERLNTELAETNRGVVALYAELDEKAESLRKASEYKSRFLSDMTHELRTPLNAIISITRLLIERTDGDLTPEQEKQVNFINRSASSLGEMVNDLLDLAKIEAGKTDLHLAEVNVADLLAAVRGMFRALNLDQKVTLTVSEPDDLQKIFTDERKLSQILRNLVSNALKFTERGEVSVEAEFTDYATVIFRVKDTGIGIDERNLQVIFHDYTQIDSGPQRRVKGTGLGLPLTRKLVHLLGGTIAVNSETGVGSVFMVTLPVTCPTAAESDVENDVERHSHV